MEFLQLGSSASVVQDSVFRPTTSTAGRVGDTMGQPGAPEAEGFCGYWRPKLANFKVFTYPIYDVGLPGGLQPNHVPGGGKFVDFGDSNFKPPHILPSVGLYTVSWWSGLPWQLLQNVFLNVCVNHIRHIQSGHPIQSRMNGIQETTGGCCSPPTYPTRPALCHQVTTRSQASTSPLGQHFPTRPALYHQATGHHCH